jgi:DNA-binding response OmpR family regulator
MSKFLIVDDDLDVTRMLSKLLQHRGHAVQSCATPFGVSAVVLRENPDLIILDVLMPGLEGPQLAELIGNLPLKKRPPVVLWSAMDADQLRKTGVRAGLPTVSKMMAPTDLVARLEKLASAPSTGSFKLSKD